mmetsp:Transcript_1368/g.4676  ORF Transcript_1368/g.4676 Transcript_1368/m.4676 type:complete len:398 (+) Transcript_1368:394-1587(+)
MFDRINKEWDIASDAMSPYLYFGCLGSGLFISLVALLVQSGVAVVLLSYYLRQSERSKSELDKDNRRSWARHDGLWPCKVHGKNNGSHLSEVMITLIAIYYLFKVVPDQCVNVVSVMGYFSTGQAKLVTLRRLISLSNEDSLRMKFGFRLHLVLNTAFDCSLYLLNLYLLWHTRNAIEILLNSLAIEFIRSLDESFCASAWFDPNGRYIKASAFEMVLRHFLDATAIEDRFFRRRKKKKGSSGSANDDCDCVADDGEITYRQETLSDDEEDERPSSARPLSYQAYLRSSSRFVEANLDKQLRHFYGDDSSSRSIAGFQSLMFGRYKRSVFQRWTRYRCWDRWHVEESDFDRKAHVRTSNDIFDSWTLAYGDVPGFPSVPFFAQCRVVRQCCFFLEPT